MSRIARVILTAIMSVVSTLLILPLAINLATGGDPPKALEPYVNWLWPVIIACLALLTGLQVWEKLRSPRSEFSARHPQHPSNCQLALEQVSHYLDNLQQGSLAERARLSIVLDERPEAVRQPAHLVQRVTGKEFDLSLDQTIAEVFEQMNESMLILGAPGSGKTTQLVELAGSLVEQSKDIGRVDSAPDSQEPAIPVVVDLADWSQRRRRFGIRSGSSDHAHHRKFDTWMLTTLERRYGIPANICELWLRDNRFILLLDGLDELPELDRARCVDSINDLQSQWGVTRLVVCSREDDYTQLTRRLQLQGAVVIRPLTDKQVRDYISQIAVHSMGRDAEWEADQELLELFASPLTLNIMLLTRPERTWHDMSTADDSASRRGILLDAYVVEMLARKRRAQKHERPEQTIRAIRTLARASSEVAAGVEVVPISPETAEYIFGWRVSSIAQLWMFIPSFAVWAVVSAAAVTQLFNLAAGLIVSVACVLFLRLCWDDIAGRPTRSARITNVIPVLAYFSLTAVAATCSIFVFILSIRLLRDSQAPVLAASAFIFTLAIGASWWVYVITEAEERVYVRRIIVFGAVTAAIILVVRPGPSALDAWAAGLVSGAGIWMCATLLAAGPRSLGGVELEEERAAGRARPVGIVLLVLAAIAIVAAPFALENSMAAAYSALDEVFGDTMSVASVLGVIAYINGHVYGFLIGVVLAFTQIGSFARLAMVTAGEPVPWRPTFLKYATDRGLLASVDGEYRFVHLLIRDHLATCNPRQLSSAVLQRRAEIAANDLRSAPGG